LVFVAASVPAVFGFGRMDCPAANRGTDGVFDSVGEEAHAKFEKRRATIPRNNRAWNRNGAVDVRITRLG